MFHRELNCWEKDAIEQFGKSARNLIYSHYAQAYKFNKDHVLALHYLINTKKLSLVEAFDVMEGLEYYQLRGICIGLTRDEAKLFKNLTYIVMLEDGSQYKLTVEMLKPFAHKNFDAQHYHAFMHLVKDRGWQARDALNEIDELTDDQAEGIKNGLFRNDIKDLKNIWSIRLLAKFHSHKELLLQQSDFKNFNQTQHFTLIHLVDVRKLSLEDALNEIDGMTHTQLIAITNGLEQKDVTQLTNNTLLFLFADFKDQGLTAERLQNVRYYNFNSSHRFAIDVLIKTHGLTIFEALDEIVGLNEKQLSGIQKKLRREDVNFT